MLLCAGSLSQLAVSTSLVNISEEAVTRFTPSERKCYEEESDDIQLSHFPYVSDYRCEAVQSAGLTQSPSRYEMFNCLYEAALQEAVRKCSCYPGYLNPSNSSCSGQSLRCFQDVFYYLGKYRTVEDRGETKSCMAACRDQTFGVTVSGSKYPAEESYNHRPAFCVIVKKLYSLTCPDTSLRRSLEKRYPGLCRDVEDVMENSACDDLWTKGGLGDDSERIDHFEENILRYMKENTALLNIYLKEPYCEKVSQNVHITLSTLVANIGGILGLCLGASIITILEIVWYCLKPCTNICKNR